MLYQSALRAVPEKPILVRDRASRRPVPFLARDNSGSYRTFLEDLRQFISLRLDRVDPYRESAAYRRQQEEASRLYERLRESLPEAGQTLLLQYSEALGAAHCLETEIMAEKAFMDGMRIAVRALTDESNVEF
ncbi:MAG: hypothetical protein ACM3ZC_01360 [Bacteroidota bacterium]